MSNRFEKLIEYVINDEDDKARELFHDIVVEKSRQIYEEMMDQEEMSEAKEEDDEEVTEAREEDDEEVTEGMDGDDAMGRMDQYDEGMMGGDAADDLIDDVEMEEEGMSMEAMGDDDDMGDDMGGEEDLEDRVIKLEDEVDRLVAEFEDLMDGDFGDEDMDVHGGDELEMDDTEEFGDDEGEAEFGGDMDDMDDMGGKGMMENVSLKAAPKPTTSEEGGINKKAVYAANSGATGMQGKPVHTGASMGGKNDTSAYSNSHKDLISDFQNKAGNSMKDQKAAPKPVTSQATGVNTKSPLKGR
jgi:hypothetical protein